MKCDVVVCFYRKQHLWPLVARGLAVNADHINTVWICNDEKWDTEMQYRLARTVNGRFETVYLWHEHDGFGAARSINEGAKKVRTEYFLQMDDDIVLRKNCIATLLEEAHETLLLGGICDDIKIKRKDGDLHDDSLVRMDRRRYGLSDPRARFLDVRDCLLLCNKKEYWAVGGHDEAYKGYGFIDYDFGIRWMMRNGLESFQMGNGKAWNIGGLEQPHAWSPDNKARFDVMEAKWRDFLVKDD